VPFKTCSYDCIYCQLGRTTRKTVERREWLAIDAVLDDLKRRLSCRPDYITLSGSGEPTLNSRLGECIEHIQAMTKIPVAVLTNGSLLWQKQVREELAMADVVLPSLDVGDAFKFAFINRPHENLTFDQVIDGLISFRSEYTGQYWLEVFLLGGYTGIEADVKKLARWVTRIRPDRVQLNTVTRPPVENFAVSVSANQLAHFARLFRPTAEVIAERPSRLSSKAARLDFGAVLDLLRRRPCTAEQIASGLGLNRLEILKCLEVLERKGDIATSPHEGQVFYYANAVSNSNVPVSHPPG